MDVADAALRQLARWLLTSTSFRTVTEIRRDDIEDFKAWLTALLGHRSMEMTLI